MASSEPYYRNAANTRVGSGETAASGWVPADRGLNACWTKSTKSFICWTSECTWIDKALSWSCCHQNHPFLKDFVYYYNLFFNAREHGLGVSLRVQVGNWGSWVDMLRLVVVLVLPFQNLFVSKQDIKRCLVPLNLKDKMIGSIFLGLSLTGVNIPFLFPLLFVPVYGGQFCR